MKKVLKLFIMLLFAIPFYVNASSYGIENFYVNGYQEDNGDLTVEYYFDMNGSYNGTELDINYINDSLYEFNADASSYGASKIYNGSSIAILEVQGVDSDYNFDFNNVDGDIFKKVSSANKGDYGVYTTSYSSKGTILMIYNPSKNNKAFYVKFRIRNIAVKHNDVGELFYSIFNDRFRESIHHLKGKFYFKDNKNLRVWAHGPLNGEVKNENNEYLTFNLDNVPAYTKIDIRATFDVDVIKNSSKNTKVDALNKIILYETNKAEQANYERQQKDYAVISYVDTGISELEDELINNLDEEVINETIFSIRDKFVNVKAKYNEIYDAEKKNKYKDKLDILNKKINEYIVIRNDKDIEIFENEITRENYNNCLTSYEYLPSDLKDEYNDKINSIKVKLDDIEKNYILSDIDYLVKSPRYYTYKNIEDKIGMIDNYENRVFLYSVLKSKLPLVKNAEYEKETCYRFLAVVSIIVTIFVFYEMYKKKFKPYDVSFNEKYYREIPSELPCEVVSYLMYNKLTDKAVSAAMLDLIRKKKISYEKISNKNYRIKDISNDDLLYEERKLMDVIFANSKEVTTADLKKRANKSYRSVISKWKIYKEAIVNRVNIENLFECKFKKSDDIKKNNLLFVIVFAVCFPVVVIPVLLIYGLVKLIKDIFKKSKDGKDLIYYRIGFSFMIILSFGEIFELIEMFKLVHASKFLFGIALLLSIVCLVYSFVKVRKTETGELEYRKWLGLKHFLDDFGTKDKEIPDVLLWERYLVYATLFGNAKKVSKVMQLNIKDTNIDSDIIGNDILDFYRMNNIISNSIRATEAKAYQSKSSHEGGSSSGGSFSSGSGGGGGFSSSSSGGGGGTGGGRF